jgi:thioesterase domain-containing protein
VIDLPEAAEADRPDKPTAILVPATPSDPAGVIRAAWMEVLGVTAADPDDDFFLVGGTSLKGAQLLARIEGGLGRRIPIAVLVSGRTLGALLDAAGAPAAETGPLVQLRAGGARPPLVAVPGVNGNLLLYPPFAELLRVGRPVYGLQTRGVDGEQAFLESMRAIATDFADQLGALAGQPLHLFGLCWGAAAAFEVAAVLESRGTPPASVSLLDPTALGLKVGADGRSRTGGRVGFVLDRLTMYADEFQTLDWAGRRRMLAEKTGRISRAITGRPETATRDELRRRAVVEANLRALQGYRPTKISSPTRLFLAQDFEPDYGFDHRVEWLDYIEPAASVVELPGFDSGDVINTHTAALTAAVDAWLDQIEASLPARDRDSVR